jgi:Histidine kinase-, DNA gyrase B-, and HSP90-like ATPase
MSVDVREAIPRDPETWVDLRRALWPEASEEEHRKDVERFFSGTGQPGAVLLAESSSIDGRGAVTVKTWTEGGDVFVRIAHTGRGIPRDRLERIFDVGFTEKDSRVRMRVGLSNVETIVRRHGGSVEVESQLGKGTAFTIRLPQQQSPSHLLA